MSELVRANIEDVIEVDGRVALAVTVKGRGRKLRKTHAPISEPVAKGLQEYLADRQQRALLIDQQPGDRPLLLNREGQRWTRTGLGALVARIAKVAGITRFRVSPHKLRHTANVVARLAGIDAYTRSKLLGHSSPASLQRYEHLIPGELHQARDIQHASLGRYLGNGRAH